MSKEELDFLKELQAELKTQDTNGQANPRFWVVRQKEWQNCWEGSADKTIIYCADFSESYDTFEELLEALIEHGYYDEEETEYIDDLDDLDGVVNAYEVPMREVDVIKENTFFLTRRECLEHIQSNKHHYNDTVHTYAMTAWRSPQVEKLIKILTEADFNE